MILFIGAILGFLSVAFGAYAEHGLKKHITNEEFQFILTALRYNQINAVVVSVLGLFLLGSTKLASFSILRYTSYLFILGTFFFSFSIYLAIVFAMPSLMHFAPLGGIILMLAWLILAYAGVRIAQKSK